MIDECNSSQNPTQQSEILLPKFSSRQELIEGTSYQEIINKTNVETTAIVSFLSNLTQTIQTNHIINHETIHGLILCIQYIKQNNFFFNNELLKQVMSLLNDFIKAVDQGINDLNIRQLIFEKVFIAYENILQYDYKGKYMTMLYEVNKEIFLAQAFDYDIAKIIGKDEIDRNEIRQLELIYDVVKWKIDKMRRNDIGKLLYDIRIFGRVIYRKGSFQLSMKNKIKTKSNVKNKQNQDIKSTFNDDDIIQVFTEEKPKIKGKGSYSLRHFSKSHNKNIMEQCMIRWNIKPLIKETNKNEEVYKEQAIEDNKENMKVIEEKNIINPNQPIINPQEKEDHLNQVTTIESIDNIINKSNDELQNDMFIPVIPSLNNKVIEDNLLMTTNHNLFEIEINTIKSNQQLNNYDDVLNHSNNPSSQLFPQNIDITNTNARAQSQENVLTNININAIKMNPNTNSANNSMKNIEVFNPIQNQNHNKINNTKQQDQKTIMNNYPQNQNYAQMNMNMQQMANLYQNMMSMNTQHYNRNFFHSNNSNAQYNHMNNQTNLTPEQLKADYLTLKSLEHDNAATIKSNLIKYEQYIILPIYQQLNRSINQKKNNYADVYNRYKPIILSVLTKNQLEKSIVQPFGSIVNNFLLDEGDVDICIVPDNCTIEDFSVYLNEINEEIQGNHYGPCVLSHISPRYSLLKINDNEGGMTVDITVQSMLPLYNTRLIRAYSLYDQRFHILGIYIKYWVKRNKINGATDHYLSSYALIIMMIHFLQMEIKPSVLPVLQKVTNENKIYEYSHSEKVFRCNVYFEEDISKIKNYMSIINNNNENKDSVGALLVKFFEFYAYNYDHSYLISISNSDKIPASNEHIAFPIDDPFDEEHNPGKSMKLNTIQYDSFINCMKKEINHILRGDFMSNDFVLGYY